MATPPIPRTQLTKRLEPSKRQFFQWYNLETQPIKWIKLEMDKLSLALYHITGDNFQAESVFLPAFFDPRTKLTIIRCSEGQWRYRQRTWNKEWRIKRRDRGPNLHVPDNILHLQLWRRGDHDVGDWRYNISPPIVRPPAGYCSQNSSLRRLLGLEATANQGTLKIDNAHEHHIKDNATPYYKLGKIKELSSPQQLTYGLWDSQIVTTDCGADYSSMTQTWLPVGETEQRHNQFTSHVGLPSTTLSFHPTPIHVECQDRSWDSGFNIPVDGYSPSYRRIDEGLPYNYRSDQSGHTASAFTVANPQGYSFAS